LGRYRVAINGVFVRRHRAFVGGEKERDYCLQDVDEIFERSEFEIGEMAAHRVPQADAAAAFQMRAGGGAGEGVVEMVQERAHFR
jgi:hypothetical protein